MPGAKGRRERRLLPLTTDGELIEAAGRALFGDRYKADLAAALGVSRDSVDDWVKGRMSPRPGVWTDLGALARTRARILDDLGPEILARAGA